MHASVQQNTTERENEVPASNDYTPSGHGDGPGAQVSDPLADLRERFQPVLEKFGSDNHQNVVLQATYGRVVNQAAQTIADNMLAPSGAEWVDLEEIDAEGPPEPVPPSSVPILDAPVGEGLFYPATLNTVFGDSEVGKSLLNHAAHAWFILQERHTVHLEFDGNNMRVFYWGVVRAGVPRDLAKKFLHVLNAPPDLPEVGFEPAYVSLDAMNPAVAHLGLEINNSPVGIDKVVQTFITPFTDRGATAVAFDHVNHSEKSRASHSIRKNQAVSGISYRMEVVGEGGKAGTRWMSTLTPVKDRPGYGPPKEKVAAYIVFDGRSDGGTCDVGVWRNPGTDLLSQEYGGEIDADHIDNPDHRLIYKIVSGVSEVALTTPNVIEEYKAKGGEASDRTVKRVLETLYEKGEIEGEQRGKGKTAPWYWWAKSSAESTQ